MTATPDTRATRPRRRLPYNAVSGYARAPWPFALDWRWLAYGAAAWIVLHLLR